MITQIAGWVALIGFAGMLCFQIVLACGAPLGKVAWGGRFRVLPNNLKIASLISVVIYIFGLVSVMEKMSIYFLMHNPNIASVFIWVLVGIFGLSTVGNIYSTSRIEKQVMLPIAIILFISCFIVAIG